MAFINWTEDFTTGIDSIDDQHRHLVDLVNKFEEASRRGRGSGVLSKILDDLLGYTQEHFAHEEKIMGECEYPGLKDHMARHRELLQNIELFQHEFATKGRRVTNDVRELLIYWVNSHIRQDDMAFAKYQEKTRIPS